MLNPSGNRENPSAVDKLICLKRFVCKFKFFIMNAISFTDTESAMLNTATCLIQENKFTENTIPIKLKIYTFIRVGFTVNKISFSPHN